MLISDQARDLVKNCFEGPPLPMVYVEKARVIERE